MSSFINKTLQTKLGQDILWNYMSLGVLAVSGILINVIIAGVYGVATLGVFNQVYAVYIMTSQFAVGGVHFSVLKHMAEFADDVNKRNKIASSAIVLSMVLGVTTGAIVFSLKNIFGNLLESPEVAKGIAFVAPALVFFALNKVLMAVLNGLRRMKAFAFAQATRYLLLISFVVISSVSNFPGYVLTATFVVSEFILLLILLILVRRYVSWVHWNQWGDWFIKHAVFGIKGFLSGILVEINTRVDVLMLGFFLSDKVVGIYSFAAILAEGFYQFLLIIRNNLNPILVKLILEERFDEIKYLVRKTQRILYPSMAALVLLVIALFPLAISALFGESDLILGWPVLAILATGIFISSGYVPFEGIMMQAGLPEYHTLLIISAVVSNIILNAILIPVFGMNGAAIATGISFVLLIVYLNILIKKKLHFSLR